MCEIPKLNIQADAAVAKSIPRPSFDTVMPLAEMAMDLWYTSSNHNCPWLASPAQFPRSALGRFALSPAAEVNRRTLIKAEIGTGAVEASADVRWVDGRPVFATAQPADESALEPQPSVDSPASGRSSGKSRSSIDCPPTPTDGPNLSWPVDNKGVLKQG